MRAPPYLPRHPRAIEALRAVREGLDLASVLGDDLAHVLGSLTRGCRPPAVRRDDAGLRLTTRGRELLALAGLPLQREWRGFRVVHALAPRTLAVLRGLPAVAEGTRPQALGWLRRCGLIVQADGAWTLTARGVEACEAGVTVRYAPRRVRTFSIGGGS